MGMTLTEKILARHAGLDTVKPGDLINAKVDIALANDITAPIAIEEFHKSRAKRVFDTERVVLVLDHFVPNKDIKSAMQCKIVRNFAREQNIVNFFDSDEMGIEHALLPEKGLVLPGDLIIGADSHTCTYGALGAFSTGVGSTDFAAAMITGELWFRVPETMKFVYTGRLNPWVGGKDLILYTIGDIGVDGALYKAMEFTGPVIKMLDMSGRLTMANMATEAGAKNGIFEPDDVTEAYVSGRAIRPYDIIRADSDAEYSDVREYDVSGIEPQVAFPHLPENTRGISEVGKISIDQVVIGSCTNGRIEDLRIAAEILKGKRKDPNTRLIVIPATTSIYRTALGEGLLEIFLDAGAFISPPTCGPCLGGYMGILASGERAVTTTNRNFVGRMGHPESEVYLANPAVAAASAVLGRIGGPDEVMD
ncbi:MAG: 3-isopropylmalate dehydratase large subunit [Deltaproteobacteria bacterium]|nr:3-isopropylmalate dehydratase large subunit [Deltaproteobacteria bacterium]MBW1960426.1 3-isopropylmalate dehydratase large subunit [Deltaproteobacteria bacterium]MBW1995708.1 3-isopropylmalate dehydratase large subunit [Deltaproteobacteria bacterium]MBW2153408.1 3-isopropylmalate dehydratase large subunit [Deltaproteobacteria bacterium]